MELHEKIRLMRELNHWTQEELAEKLNISPSGYAKIERGENSVNVERLEQIANVFNIDVWQLMKPDDKTYVLQIINKDNQTISESSSAIFSVNSNTAEVEKLELIVQYQKELLAQKDKDIVRLEEIIALLKK